MSFRYEGVERIPKQLAPGVVYHSEKFGIGALLCACGCRHRVDLIVPESHRVTAKDGLATVHPSIAVCDAACKSHYIIRAGHVQWLRAFSDAQASFVMKGQIARHAASQPKNLTVWGHIRKFAARVVKQVKSLFGF